MDIAGIGWWIVTLFLLAFGIGVVSPLSGVGGGVLFVPLATAFFPFSIDFIRGAGLIMALTSALSSVPYLTEKKLVNIKLMIPLAAVSNVTAIIGGMVGIWLTNFPPRGQAYISIALGILLFFIFMLMINSKDVEFPKIRKVDTISKKLDLSGSWYEVSLKKVVKYEITNLPLGLLFFAVVGFIAGMFGLGAGWASVPVLNLIMGAPIKVACATSMGIIALTSSAASWVYMAKGAILPLICIPSVTGITIGARIGAKLAARAKPLFVKYLVVGIMIFAAIIDILKGLKALGIF